MNILLTHGTGSGPTEMAAFDKALVDAGVANYNLLYLSSVLPPGSTIVEEKPKPYAYGEWGDRLYVVMAQMRVSKANEEAWAGIGWIQDKEDDRGLLVEHEGHTEALVRSDIENSLMALSRNRRHKFGPINMVVTGTTCSGLPVCALVVAVFEGKSWKNANRQGRILSWMNKGKEKESK
jgi:arginine decarboxylase